MRIHIHQTVGYCSFENTQVGHSLVTNSVAAWPTCTQHISMLHSSSSPSVTLAISTSFTFVGGILFFAVCGPHSEAVQLLKSYIVVTTGAGGGGAPAPTPSPVSESSAQAITLWIAVIQLAVSAMLQMTMMLKCRVSVHSTISFISKIMLSQGAEDRQLPDPVT